MNFKKIIYNPYLQPVMMPLKWIGGAVAFTTGPYIRAAQKARSNPSEPNPFLNYLDKLLDEAGGLVAAPVVIGALGGLVGGIVLSAHLLSGAGVLAGIMGGLAITSAVAAATVALAPVATAAVILGATLIAATSVATVPGVLYGMKKTVDHVFSRNTVQAQAPTAVIDAPAPTTLEQLTTHISSMTPGEQQQLLNQLRHKASNDFAITAAVAAGTDENISVPKTIQLKKPKR